MRSEPNQPEEGMPLASWLCLGEGQEATWPPRTVQQPLPEQCAIQVATGVRAVSSGKERAQREASRAAFAPHCSLCTFALSGPIGKGQGPNCQLQVISASVERGRREQDGEWGGEENPHREASRELNPGQDAARRWREGGREATPSLLGPVTRDVPL